MPRTAVVKLVSLKNALVNLPMSVYGPLVEHGTVGRLVLLPTSPD